MRGSQGLVFRLQGAVRAQAFFSPLAVYGITANLARNWTGILIIWAAAFPSRLTGWIQPVSTSVIKRISRAELGWRRHCRRSRCTAIIIFAIGILNFHWDWNTRH